MTLEAETIALVIVAFVVGGTIKGILGLGILIVTLAILTLALDLLTAMALLLAPAIVTNVWQALAGGGFSRLIRRLWAFLACGMLSVMLASLALTRIELPWLTALLGLVLVAYAGLSLGGVRFDLAERSENWLGPVFGILSGAITGMTGSTVVPGTLYLQALGLGRDDLVQAMGMLYLALALALCLALQVNGLLSLQLGIYSIAAVPSALLGMWLGQRIRRRLAEARFRQVFFIALMLIGVHILVKSLRLAL